MVAPVALVLAVIAIALSVVALIRSSRSSSPKGSAAPTHPVCQTDLSGWADFVRSVRSPGHGAYESQPVNIAGNGTFHFNPRPDVAHIEAFKVKGALHVRMPLIVTDATQPCTALRTWAQF
jgi:hypothetical protein